MKFQFAQSSREIEALTITKFAVVQDNRTKTVHILEYQTTRGISEMAFLNGVEAKLQPNGRYVQAKSNKDDCAKILPDVIPEEEVKPITLPVISNEEAIALIEASKKELLEA